MSETYQFTQNQKGIAALFNELELKTYFKKYLILIGGLEIFIFIAFWFYQLGVKEYDRFGPVDIPFPWQTYFMVAFLAPLAITFLLGIFIVAFNKYLYGSSASASFGSDAKKSEKSKKLGAFLNAVLNIPFLFALLLLGLGVGLIYRIEDVVLLIGHVGEKSAQFILIILGAALAVGTVIGVVWLILNYKLRKKSMEYEYKNEVMERLGLAILDDNTVVNQNGNAIELKENVLLLPPVSSEKIKN
ncbi:conserved membrane hypothetical protein [Candidatus Magnetomoraceae bacterium gMMP-15]